MMNATPRLSAVHTAGTGLGIYEVDASSNIKVAVSTSDGAARCGVVRGKAACVCPITKTHIMVVVVAVFVSLTLLGHYPSGRLSIKRLMALPWSQWPLWPRRRARRLTTRLG